VVPPADEVAKAEEYDAEEMVIVLVFGCVYFLFSLLKKELM
jgi:hypothetical protein